MARSWPTGPGSRSITRDRPLIVTSQMAESGVIFSDGIESDYLAFTAGLSVTVGLAQKKANLVMPG
jgi:hypothetical protein